MAVPSGPSRRRLSAQDWRTLGGVLLAQLVLGGAIRVARVRVLWRTIPAFRVAARRLVSAPDERVAWAIEAVGRRLPRLSTCLVRALAADLFLSAPGRTGRVRIGVRRGEAGELQSHAWFEREGRIVVGAAGASDYVELPINN